MSTRNPSCIVIGAGIVGSSCAWHLRRRGAEVTLIDSEMPGQSTSFGNAGCISPSSITPFSYPGAIRQVPGWLLDPLGPMRIRWTQGLNLAPWFLKFWKTCNWPRVSEISAAQHSLMKSVTRDYDEILRETGAESLRNSEGMIMLYGNETELAADEWHYDFRRKFDIPYQRLSRGELQDLEPAVQMGDNGIAVLDPMWQHVLSPADVTRAIAESAIAQGVNWLQDRVGGVVNQADGVSVVTQSGRQVKADYLVLATAVWSNSLLGQLGHKVPLMAKRGYHSMLAQPNVQLRRPLMSVSEYVVITPMRDGLRIAGTAEFARVDAKPDYRRAKALVKHAQRFLPGVAGTSVSEWMGQRPIMPDSMPVLGPLPGKERILCAFGHGHYGLTQGPTTGRIITDLVFGQPTTPDLAPFSINRFKGK